jgi:hypothetical protein
VLIERDIPTPQTRGSEVVRPWMMDKYGGPKSVAGGPREGVPGVTWGRGYHRTRPEYLKSIFDTGLVPGGSHVGQMSVSTGYEAMGE